ncbi:MBL fold metallo-hydrolase [Streptomyces sp. BBFR102]|uniref:MBL fold metallo-hydrolase n=1 Tax=Streptomyces sp. BBFR102 TaxID=3448171 RepID=UPI003F52E2A6
MISTYFGTSTIHVTDGRSSLLVDGFLTRPPLLRVALGRIASDSGRIASALARGDVTRLDALFVAHSHYDHVLDSAEVVRLLGGGLHGSHSTLNVGRGAGLPERSMTVIHDGDRITVGAFTVRVLEGPHSPGDRYPGTIDTPLVPPAKARDYRTGNCYSFLITHPTGTMLIHPSANYTPHKYDGLDVDFLYLGVGALGARTRRFQDAYWHHVVEATRPGHIVPIHWDNFGRPLTRKLRPLPFLFDRFRRTRRLLDRRTAADGIPWHFQQPFEPLTPFRLREPGR